MQKRRSDGPGPPPSLPALDLLGDHTRRRIIWELAYNPRTVTELAGRIEQSQPLVSKHLRILRDAELVECRPHPNRSRLLQGPPSRPKRHHARHAAHPQPPPAKGSLGALTRLDRRRSARGRVRTDRFCF